MPQVTPSHKIHAAFTLNHVFNAFHLELTAAAPPPPAPAEAAPVAAAAAAAAGFEI
jgi:hypothetical protein